MEIQELRVFAAIVDTGGFKFAASKLGITQPAVSQSLANLERKLGEKILVRSTPARPTPIGKELLKHARYVIESESSFELHLSKLKSGHLQQLTLAVDHLAANYYCPKLATSFHKVLPEAEVKIQRMPAREIISAIRNRQALIGLGPFQKKMEGLHSIKLKTEESILVTSKKNPLLKIYRRDPMRFLEETPLLTSFLDDPRARPSKKKIRDYFKNTWQINDINLQLKIINQGIGATFLAKSYLKNEAKLDDLVTLDKVPFAQIKKNYGVYLLKEDIKLPMVEKFLELF